MNFTAISAGINQFNFSQYLASGTSIYPWSLSGFGTKFAAPSTTVTGTQNGVAFGPANNDVFISAGSSPYINAYPFSSSGFGTKYANPATIPTSGAPSGIAVSFLSDYYGTTPQVGVTGATSPYISVYPWYSGTGFGTRMTNPASLPLGQTLRMAFSPPNSTSQTALAVGHFTSPYISAYFWQSLSGFGTKYAAPASTPTGRIVDEKFSPSGKDIVMAIANSSPYIHAYSWSQSSGFGTKYADPATVAGAGALSIAFSPLGDAIAVGHFSSPYQTVYPWVSGTGFGTKYTDPATANPGTSANGVSFSSSNTHLAAASSNSPGYNVWAWSSTGGFGTKYSNPSVISSIQGNIAFSN